MRTRREWVSLVAVVISAAACARERPRKEGSPHPAGWGTAGEDEFHAGYMQENCFPLAECRECHGDDYAGGNVGVGCIEGCHESEGGPEACGNCHGEGAEPRPDTGSHGEHAAFCDTCHVVPAEFEAEGHVDEDCEAEVQLSGLAETDGHSPAWDEGTGTCSDVYCHAPFDPNDSPVWGEGEAECGSCHDAPPGNHARFSRVATRERCGDCHDDEAHVDGDIDFSGLDFCDLCHGSGDSGAPPPALDGSVDATAPGVGAHQRHLDPDLGDRIGKTVDCEDCHTVPTSAFDDGHMDDAAPADVALMDEGVYDDAGQSCVVYCHWENDPGPTWTDTSGDPRQCGACHEMPPPIGLSSHDAVTWDGDVDSDCSCHTYAVETHVDGSRTF